MSARIFLLGEGSEDNRKKRMLEEFKKIGKTPLFLNVFNLKITTEGIFYNDKKIVFRNNDLLWSISNSVIIEKLTACSFFKKAFVWPESQINFFSDKFLGNCFFAQNNIPTPKTALLNRCDIAKLVSDIGGFPCIIKRTNGSHGTEVATVNSEEDIANFLEKIYHKRLALLRKWEDDFCFILQEYIEESAGADFRVLCLENDIIGGIKRTSKNGDFRANVSLGGNASVFDVPDDLRKICHKIMKEGNLFYAGLDFVKSKRGWLAIEVNTCAQFKGFEKATQINVAEKIVTALMRKV